VVAVSNQEDPIFEYRRCEWLSDCVEINEIDVIRVQFITKIDAQPKEHVVVSPICWLVFVSLDRKIDVARIVGRLSGVRTEQNREPDRMLSEHSLNGPNIEVALESGRFNGSHTLRYILR
jgi:hypothetical protein